MLLALGHTLNTKTQDVKLVIASLIANSIVFGTNYKSNKPQMAQSLVNMLHKALTFQWAKHHLYSSIHPHMQKGIIFPFELLGPMHTIVPFIGC